MKPYFLCLFFCFLITYMPANAQSTVRNLLFNSANNITRLDFSTTPPTVIPTGIPDAGGVAEAIAHYENSAGDIIFWINSNGVYDRNDSLMSGSVGILTNSSATEVTICPKPNNPNKYYIIYNTETASPLYYSVVDMDLNGGLGNVTNLNIPISNDAYAEGLEIVRIPSTCEYWLLAYKYDVGFVRFNINADNINNETLIYEFTNPAGYDGRGELDYYNGKMGACFAFSNTVFLANFDATEGTISNPIVLNDAAFNNAPYGLEFSPDATKAYFSLWYSSFLPKYLYQYDFVTNQYTGFNLANNNFGQIEMGPDGKLYVIHDTSTGITVIDNANETMPTFSTINTLHSLGLGISDFIQLPPNLSTLFNQSWCVNPDSIVVLSTPYPSFVYDWVDATNPSNILYTGNSYSFVMPDTTVHIQAIISGEGACSDTVKFNLEPIAIVDAGNSVFLQQGQSTILAGSSSTESSYIWFPSEGLNNPFILNPIATPTQTTTYTLSVLNGLCQMSDTVTVYVANAIGIDAATNTSILGNTFIQQQQLYVSLNKQINTNGTLSLRNMAGQIVWSLEVSLDTPKQINTNIAQLPIGVYLLTLQTTNGVYIF
jgi:hypothetical protein